ncbi:MAG: DNRLRE domain-containing protein [Candidatus Cloacimonadales bacterium]
MFKYKGILFSLILFTLILGCTDKKNQLGFEGENPPTEIILGDSIFVEIEDNKFYSFEDSVKNYHSNSKLLVANYQMNNFQNEVRSLFRVTTTPDTILSIDSEITLTLPIKTKSDNFSETDLKFGQLESAWNSTKTDWFTAIDSTDAPEWQTPGGDFSEFIPQAVTLSGDSLIIQLSEEMLESWIETPTENYGIIIYTETAETILEFYASEAATRPYLDFEYTYKDGEAATFHKTFTHDVSIAKTDEQFEIYPNRLIFSNLQPIRSFLKFELLPEYFAGINDSIDFRRMTINKAELYFTRKTDQPYFEQNSFSIKPYLVIAAADQLDPQDQSQPFIADDDYEEFFNIASADSLLSAEADIFKVDISRIVQHIVADEVDNNGVLLRSIYENRDLQHLEFEPNVELRLIYTTPIISE